MNFWVYLCRYIYEVQLILIEVFSFRVICYIIFRLCMIFC
eukprot:UN11959